MRGETLLSVQQLAIAMGIMTIAVAVAVVWGFIAFKKWEKREEIRRGGQIALAQLDPDCAEIGSDRSFSDQ